MSDFTLVNHGSICVLTAVSQEAKDWTEAHLPEDCPMWGRDGFAIETNYIGPIVDGIVCDGLEVS